MNDAITVLAFLALAAGCSCGEEPRPIVEEEPTRPVDRFADTPLPPVREGMHSALLAPQLAREEAPESFRVLVQTSKGEIEIECVRAWAPRAVDRFYNLIRIGYYVDIPIHGRVKGHFVLFGSHTNPDVQAAWKRATMVDEPARQSNRRGYLSFFKKEKRDNSRTISIVINLSDHPELDEHTAPFGRITRGLGVAEKLVTFNADDGSDLEAQEKRSVLHLVLGGKVNLMKLDMIESISFLEEEE